MVERTEQNTAEKIDKKNLKCPYCDHVFPIVGNVVTRTRTPIGSGRCKAWAICPSCSKESCANWDELTNKPKYDEPESTL